MGQAVGQGPPACYAPIYQNMAMTSCEDCEYKNTCYNKGAFPKQTGILE